MTRKDNIFFTFIKHGLLKEKYGINEVDIPRSLEEAFKSKHAIIKAIAIIVYNTEVVKPPFTDKQLYTVLNQFLNESAI